MEDTFLGLMVIFFVTSMCPFLHIFDNYKLQIEPLKSFLGRSILHYYHFRNI